MLTFQLIHRIRIYENVMISSFFLQVVVAGALCNRDQIYLYSKCASRYVGITPDGKLLAYDNTGVDHPHGMWKHTYFISLQFDF